MSTPLCFIMLCANKIMKLTIMNNATVAHLDLMKETNITTLGLLNLVSNL